MISTSLSQLYAALCLLSMLSVGSWCLPAAEQKVMESELGPLVVRLNTAHPDGLDSLRMLFRENNPGYDLEYVHQIDRYVATEPTLLFVQSGGGTCRFPDFSSKFSVGDILILRANESLTTDSLFNGLGFILPENVPADLPNIIRPDWDPNITDVPGGCATETNAYRRILLTWKKSVGHYILHSLNAHRVRIMNSFTHYHPVVGGFDEFYLVQMAQPKAKILTSRSLDKILDHTSITENEVESLMQTTPLQVHDLVYLPRGMIHRGMDGVLAQVITVPGFIPGAEIGVDHLLRKIQERLALTHETIPFNEEASEKPIIK